MKDESTPINGEIKLLSIDKPLIFLVIGTVLLIVVLVFLFTRPTFWNQLDFSDTGQIGDTIGGIASPVIALLGAILIYKSFFAQIEANRIQRESMIKQLGVTQAQQDFSILMDIFKQIKNDYDSLFFRKGDKDYFGKRALFLFQKTLEFDPPKAKKQSIVKDLRYLVKVFSLLIRKTSKSQIGDQDKDLVNSLLLIFYGTKLETYVTNLIRISKKNKVVDTLMESLEDLKITIQQCE